jgi:transposase
MRKGFNGLSGLVNNELDRNVLSGDVFIFVNRRRTLIKLLVWDKSGFVIYYKRLEQGTFKFPTSSGESKSLELEREDLLMILEGIELKSVVKRKRYRPEISMKKRNNIS